jgi:hypothetical protein
MSGVWAIARNLVKEVLRMRVLVVFTILITFSYTFFFAWWLHRGIGQADEKVQTFLSYSLSFTAGFLALLTIFVSIATITRDIKRKEIFTIATKPVSRGQYMIGKFLGMALLNFACLLITAGAIYGLARLLQYREPQNDYEKAKLKELVFVARRAVKPQLPDISDKVRKIVEQEIDQAVRSEPETYKTNPLRLKYLRQSLTRDYDKRLSMAQGAVPSGGHIVWHFTDVFPVDRENGYIYIRYKHDVSENPFDLNVVNEWGFGPKDPLIYGGDLLPPRKEVIRTVHEFPVPVSAVSPQGDLYVYYRNLTPQRNVTVLHPPDTGIEALYVAGGFEGNFIRSILMIYLRLLFLGVFGIAIGAWLSFPVAVLLVLVVYVTGLGSEFISDALIWDAGRTLRTVLTPIVSVFPKFATYDPVPQIEKGKMVSWQLLWECLFFMVLLKGGAVALFGYLVFKFRELARIIV